MQKTYHGSCHCGAVQFEADIDRRFCAVNVTCLDDGSDEELVNAPITYLDGRNDIWDAAPAEIRHL
ncbi:MAG: hypothetical protein V4631_10265 [Pseudomonadota bacterium]